MDLQPGELNHLLIRISRIHYRLSFAAFSKYGITQGQPRVLKDLAVHDGCIQRDMCHRFHLEPATLTNTLAGMERAGLIERRPQPDDRRVQRVFLTEKGREALTHVRQVHLWLEEKAFEGFSGPERAEAAGLLARISENLLKEEEQTAP